MDMAPHDFILNHKEEDLKRFLEFKHRTFNPTDTLYFIYFLKRFYESSDSLEEAFITGVDNDADNIEEGLRNFHHLFFSLHPIWI